MEKGNYPILDRIAQILYDKKGTNILALDLREISQMTDFFVIAEGSVPRHVKALAENVIEVCEQQGLRPWRVEGMEIADWIVLDYGDMMIHILIPELRMKYSLEELWHQAKIVDVRIVLN